MKLATIAKKLILLKEDGESAGKLELRKLQLIKF